MSSRVPWFSEPGMEDPILIHQFEMDYFDEFTTQDIVAALGHEDFQHSFSSESNTSSPTLIPRSNSTTSMETSQNITERPTKQQKPNNHSCTTQNISNPETSSSPLILNFGNGTLSNTQQSHGNLLGTMNQEDDVVSPGELSFVSDVLISQGPSNFNQDHATKSFQGTKRNGTATRLPSHSRDHIIAERKRREKLSERFIALSAIVPGLKKIDKTSVLGEAIKYMKQLQEQVKILEEQTGKKAVESVVIVKKSQLLVEDDNCSSDDNFAGQSDEQLPEIEARVSDKNVLLRIHCEKQKGVLVKTLSEIEKLNLTVINTSVVPFGDSTIDITIVAQMENEFSMTVKDLARSLCSAFRQFK